MRLYNPPERTNGGTEILKALLNYFQDSKEEKATHASCVQNILDLPDEYGSPSETLLQRLDDEKDPEILRKW